MARYKLTELQKQSLATAQVQLNQAREMAKQAQLRFDEITGLILDAHGLDVNGQYELDSSTWELVVVDEKIPGSDIGQSETS